MVRHYLYGVDDLSSSSNSTPSNKNNNLKEKKPHPTRILKSYPETSFVVEVKFATGLQFGVNVNSISNLCLLWVPR